MSENNSKHTLTYCNNLLTVNGVVQVLEVSPKEAQLKLADKTLVVRGSGINVTKLEREQGVVQMETQSVQSFVYKQGSTGLKGLFK